MEGNADPVFVIPPAPLSYDKRHQSNQLTFSLLPLLKPDANYTAEPASSLRRRS